MKAKDVYDNYPKTTEMDQVDAIAKAIEACKDLSDFIEIDNIIGEKEEEISTPCLAEIADLFDQKIVSVMPVEYKKIKTVEDAKKCFYFVPSDSIWKLALLRLIISLAKDYSDLQEAYEESIDENNYLFLKLINANLGHLEPK